MFCCSNTSWSEEEVVELNKEVLSGIQYIRMLR